jgi:EpsI family protein
MSNKSFISSVLIFLVTIGSVVGITSRGKAVVVSTNLENLPMEIAGFKAKEDSFEDSIYNELNADLNLYRHYRSGEHEEIDLYIAYYGTAKGGRTSHNPYGCLPGSGWGIVDSYSIKLKTNKHHDGVKVRHILARRGNSYIVMLYWYQSAGSKVLLTGIQQNIQRFVGKIMHNRNDGAFVRISILTEEYGVERADYLVKSFAKKVVDLLPKYWPIEQVT